MNSFFPFLALLGTGLVLLFVWPDVVLLKALILLLWAAFALMRGLWMSEFVFFGHVEDGEEDGPLPPSASGLAGALRSNRGKGMAQELSYKASRAFTDRSLIVAALAGLYLFWLIYMIWGGSLPAPLSELSRTIETVLSRETSSVYEVHFPAVLILNKLADAALAGLAFLLAQSFAASYTQARALLFLAVPALCLTGLIAAFTGETVFVSPQTSLTGHWIGYGYGTVPLLRSMGVIPEETLSPFIVRVYEIGMGGAVYLYVLGLYFFLSFLAALGRETYQKFQAVIGLAVLLAMVLADRYLLASPGLEAFWLSCWSALAVLFIQCRPIGHKSARLRQV